MKKSLVILAVSLPLASCIGDNGNYTYDEAGKYYPAAIASGIEDSYQKEIGDLITIQPQYEGDVDDSGYDYLWFAEYDGKRDTLGRMKDLEAPVMFRVGDYDLRLKVTNRANGISTHYQTKLSVVTPYSTGWFIVKEAGDGATDMDMVRYDGQKQLDDIIATTNGSAIPGRPVKTIYVASGAANGYEYIDTETAALTYEPVFIVATDSELWALRGSDMTIHYDTDQMFLAPPDNIKPYDMGFYVSQLAHYSILINDGDFHWMSGKNPISGARGHSGQFSDKLFGAENLDIDPHVCKVYPAMPAMSPTGMLLFFDRNSNSFKRLQAQMMPTPTSRPALNSFGSGSPSPDIPDCNEMEYELIYMKEASAIFGVGIMRSLADSKYYAFRTVNLTTSAVPATPFQSFAAMPVGTKAATASIRAVNRSNATIYSSTGNNEVWAYNVGQNSEEKILTLPAGEQVTFIEDIRSPGVFSHLVVATSVGGGWKMYCYDFEGSSDKLADQTPEKTYSGTGKVTQVIYRGTGLTPCL